MLLKGEINSWNQKIFVDINLDINDHVYITMWRVLPLTVIDLTLSLFIPFPPEGYWPLPRQLTLL
jgi:hypothetical protein